MATSRSIETDQHWIAGALLYSGRPDPAWEISGTTVQSLLQHWGSLIAWEGTLPVPPVLGYRGCFLQDPSGRKWTAFQHSVTLTQQDQTEVREDTAGTFEKLLLSSAPAGTIPPGVE
jgi:hypothetical protein